MFLRLMTLAQLTLLGFVHSRPQASTRAAVKIEYALAAVIGVALFAIIYETAFDGVSSLMDDLGDALSNRA